MHLRICAARVAAAFMLAGIIPAAAAKKEKKAPPNPLDLYVREAAQHAESATASPGSLWSPVAVYNDLGADLRARHVDDVLTIIVSEQTSAVSNGTTKTSRASSANA